MGVGGTGGWRSQNTASLASGLSNVSQISEPHAALRQGISLWIAAVPLPCSLPRDTKPRSGSSSGEGRWCVAKGFT